MPPYNRMWVFWTYSYWHDLKSMPKTVDSASGGAWEWWDGPCRRAPPQALPHARQRPRVSAVLHEGCHRLHCIVQDHLTQHALHTSCRHRIGAALPCRAPASPSKRRARVKEVAKELRDHLPPASAGKDSYTLLKFYSISTLLVSSVLKVTAEIIQSMAEQP